MISNTLFQLNDIHFFAYSVSGYYFHSNRFDRPIQGTLRGMTNQNKRLAVGVRVISNYEFTQSLRHVKNAKQGQFLIRE